MNEKYKDHIYEAVKFARNTVDYINKNTPLSNEKAYEDLVLLIIDKTVSPYHYFLENRSISGEVPTEKQIKFATELGIEKPDQYTKKELSDQIDKKLLEQKQKEGV